jgi:predicted MPP superfamily phosphohydrolase
MLTAAVLGIIAMVQGLRAPTVTPHELAFDRLPKELDDFRLVAVSDFHLGRLLGHRWFLKRVEQIDALNPDCVLAVGDVVDGSAGELTPLIPALRTLKAPKGVWAVSGNHEFYEGLEQSLGILTQAGWNVLRDQWTELAPGLVVAGVDDLTARESFGDTTDALQATLNDLPEGVTILMSHSPMHADTAARLGCSLMLCGHTHAGQIWPFNYLVRLRYRLVSGRYHVNGMPVIVGRGTGTWGPRMRLWRRSEILLIVLKARPGTNVQPQGAYTSHRAQHRDTKNAEDHRDCRPTDEPSCAHAFTIRNRGSQERSTPCPLCLRV